MCLKEKYSRVQPRESGIKTADDMSHGNSSEVNASNDIEKPELHLEPGNAKEHYQTEQCVCFDWGEREEVSPPRIIMMKPNA